MPPALRMQQATHEPAPPVKSTHQHYGHPLHMSATASRIMTTSATASHVIYYACMHHVRPLHTSATHHVLHLHQSHCCENPSDKVRINIATRCAIETKQQETTEATLENMMQAARAAAMQKGVQKLHATELRNSRE